MMEHLARAYVEEASELLGELERSLLELEERPEDQELVGSVFRALHTIKGSGAMVGFGAIATFTHELETAFDQVREGRTRVSAELIGITLDARDHIGELLAAPPEGTAELAEDSQRILDRLRRAAPRGVPTEAREDAPAAPAPAAVRAEEMHTYRVRFEPQRDILASGTNPLLLLKELAEMGECRITARLDEIPPLESFRPEECYAKWEAELTTVADENAIRDVFVFVEDRARVEVEHLETESDELRKLGRVLEAGGAEAEEGERAAVGRPAHKTEVATTLRVPAAKVDSLVNIVGELVTVQARLSSYALVSGDSEINFIAEELERLSELLRENTMSIRMLPIGDTFNRFKRLVHDLAGELGKKVELTTEGNDTELDKTVIEQLSDPLVHLIRNAVDHGIEMPERRAELGKPATGKIHLSAAHSGSFVLIGIRDDGAGLNKDAIRARAVDRGMIAADAVLTDEEIFQLIVAPGFSTAERVTALSGRGVGMDVVQRSLDSLRGTLAITSTPGAGTTMTLKIPLTLAIIDGLLVESAGSFFVVPLANVSGCSEMDRRKQTGRRDSLVDVRGELVPYISLRERFRLGGEQPPFEQVIVAETRGGRFGFVVDRVIGDHHTVVKKLGNLYRGVEEVSGATILGDGTVALILDVEKIAGEAIREAA